MSEDPESGVQTNEWISQFRVAYEEALSKIEELEGLVTSDKLATAMFKFGEATREVLAVHEGLSALYGALRSTSALFEHWNSPRLTAFDVELMPMSSWWEENRYALGYDASADFEKQVARKLYNAGYRRKHWFLKDVIVREVDFMLDVLEALIEPDWVPIGSPVEDDSEEQPERHIPSKVKMSVWRRDEGKCVNCKSNERLEYDHIIPVAKGGSNTERNVQLLCERCNREKAAKIV